MKHPTTKLGPPITIGEAMRKSGLSAINFMQALRDLESVGLIKTYQDRSLPFMPQVIARVIP